MNVKRNNLSILYLTVLVGLGILISPAKAQTGRQLDAEHRRIPWSRLSFHAKNFWVEVSTEIQMKYVPAPDLEAVLLPSPEGTPVKPKNSQAGQLTINTMVDPRFRPPVKIYNRIWFNPSDTSALGRIRLRRGEDDFKKTYRFTGQGVFRHRLEPENKTESRQAPEKWTDAKDSFYPFDTARLNCPVVSERSLLIYALATADFANPNDWPSICVFGKRQLHRVTLRYAGVSSIKVDYVEKSQQQELRRQKVVRAFKIDLFPEPMQSDLEQPENFSFLGFHRDISLYIDASTRLPVQASGIIPTIGTAHLKLRACRLHPSPP